nr:unnamed protein product [Callosobruchus chinensis]
MDDDLEFECNIGVVNVKVWVDSGCKHTLITNTTWKEMKRCKVIVSNQLQCTAEGRGKSTAVSLGILEIGLEVNHVVTEVFPKFEDVLVEIPIDCDYAIMRENHPLPTMDKLLPKIKDHKYFSKLDIRDAFHQIE